MTGMLILVSGDGNDSYTYNVYIKLADLINKGIPCFAEEFCKRNCRCGQRLNILTIY